MRRMLSLIAILLCISMPAKATEIAVIDAGEGGKLFLRQEASADAAWLGLFYSGTHVYCLSDRDEAWTKVSIGNQTGYMKSEYLRGEDMAHVGAAGQTTGEVTASGTVRIRTSPSALSEIAGYMQPGETFTILGETPARWYYVEAGGITGYVSGKLIKVLPEFRLYKSWQDAYAAHIMAQQNGRYHLIDLNGDEVPELIDECEVPGAKYRMTAFVKNTNHSLPLDEGFTFIEKENVILEATGRMDSYADVVYRLTDHGWEEAASGRYYGYRGGFDEETGRYTCQSYEWNGNPVSMEAYLDALNKAFDMHRAQKPSFPYNANEMLQLLKEEER